ncbi:MAG: DNA repair exonuclease [Deltaproteobacteria bacterium]|nr:DNA repair exonuclease [Deltaproteobacteria bacterium]
MEPFKFVHAADLHLGSPFAGVTAREPEIAQVLKDASIAAFRNLVDCVIEQDARFLLVAGDVFDLDAPSLKARLAFAEGMKRLSERGIPVFAVYGNHDPVASGFKSVALPENVHVFDSKKVESILVEVSGRTIALVSGISYAKREETRNLAAMFPVHESPLFSIGLVHANVGGVGGYENYAACSISDLAQCGVRYFALGHVHERRKVCDSPLALYPGNIQGRSFRETGPRGALVVTVDHAGGAVEVFAPLDTVRFSERALDIAPFESIGGLLDAMIRQVREMAAEADGRGLVCRLRLTGRGSLYGELAAAMAVEDLLSGLKEEFSGLSPFVWVEEIISRVLPDVDLDERRGGGDLFAQVLAISDEWRGEGFLSTKKVLADLYSNTRARDALPALTDKEIEELAEGAVLLCLDRLEGEAQ